MTTLSGVRPQFLTSDSIVTLPLPAADALHGGNMIVRWMRGVTVTGGGVECVINDQRRRWKKCKEPAAMQWRRWNPFQNVQENLFFQVKLSKQRQSWILVQNDKMGA